MYIRRPVSRGRCSAESERQPSPVVSMSLDVLVSVALTRTRGALGHQLREEKEWRLGEKVQGVQVQHNRSASETTGNC